MNTTLRCTISISTLALLTLTVIPASAQEVTRLPETTKNSVGLDTGLEGAFIARASYQRRLDREMRSDPRIYARATLPFVTPDLGDWAVDAGLRITPLEWRDFRLTVLGGPLLRRSSNQSFSGLGLGVGATMLAGYESHRWGLSLEGGYDQFLGTYLSHTDAYRETYHANAKDGWYALSGSTARAGLRGGARIGSFEIAARAGLNTTGELRPTNPPWYFTVGTSYAF